MLNVLSLGAGVQSTTMALMAAHGEITPMPDAAIFADTGAEPKAVYDHLAWLTSGNVLPFPVYIVQEGNLRDDIEKNTNTTGHRLPAVPWFMVSPKGKLGMGRRQCTSEYKLKPIRRKARELVGLEKGQRSKAVLMTMWIGISRDETFRMKPSRDRWCENRWPLVELGMTRQHCLQWMEAKGYPKPPRSACTFCPYHSDAEWRDLRDNNPDGWQDAVVVDQMIRNQPKMKAQQFAHAQRVPLDQVDLSTAEDRGQLNMFNNECEGMCGV